MFGSQLSPLKIISRANLTGLQPKYQKIKRFAFTSLILNGNEVFVLCIVYYLFLNWNYRWYCKITVQYRTL